ncbi:MAG: anthranilate synthase component I family protein [Bacteroidia bacterium]|nr:anthranilate synthase component I family protein [Bacteroidia bacterium]
MKTETLNVPIHSFPLKTRMKKRLADTITPVSVYLRLRDHFENPLLLESSDYHGNENSYSYICLEPIASFEVSRGEVFITYPDGKYESNKLQTPGELPVRLQAFSRAFEPEPSGLKFSNNGLFGFQAYDTVRYYETVEVQTYLDEARMIPDLLYRAYRYIIVINHFNNEMYLFEHIYNDREKGLDRIEALLNNPSLPLYRFRTQGEEDANNTPEEYLEMVKKGIEHCQRGDVFQIVLSRQFSQDFEGDEFNVYRALRSINPSPYLFYCDYGSFKLMGSSPEAQLVVQNGRATIHPIAGTFRRTGNDEEDSRLARKLFDDPKENSEHIMLVDLARNDLSRNGSSVKVDTFKEIQYFSHVIHLVSRVTAEITPNVSSLQLVADTFPAGTLSGAPKHMAMQLINKYENQNRGFYGGCIGYLGFDGTFNQAIMIRSFLSRKNTLYYQAGAGIVARSLPENELQEVNNKLMALRKAIRQAEEI